MGESQGKRESLLGEKGKGKGEGATFEVHSHLTTRPRTRTTRKETISRLVSPPQPPMLLEWGYIRDILEIYKGYIRVFWDEKYIIYIEM